MIKYSDSYCTEVGFDGETSMGGKYCMCETLSAQMFGLIGLKLTNGAWGGAFIKVAVVIR